jgi:ubiquinone/menaquinone biosynthesis C-methylase UbiE
MQRASDLAQEHWNETPLFLSEGERYSEYPWLYKVAEFREHRGQRVLEVGCGTGCDLLQFAKHGALATGVDITDSHLELARKRVGDMATVVKADARALPFEDGSFDYVYSHGVLHHSDEPEKAAGEILRVLRKGGKFNIHLYALFSESALIYYLKFGDRWKQQVENSTRPVHLELYTAKKFKRLFPGCAIQFSKHQCYHLEFAAPFLGWYLVGKGVKPDK